MDALKATASSLTGSGDVPGDQAKDASKEGTAGALGNVTQVLTNVGHKISQATGAGMQSSDSASADRVDGQAAGEERSATLEASDEQIQGFLREKYRSTAPQEAPVTEDEK